MKSSDKLLLAVHNQCKAFQDAFSRQFGESDIGEIEREASNLLALLTDYLTQCRES